MSPTLPALSSAEEVTLRADIVAEARSWLRTPYALGAMVKGAGVDCGLLPYAVYKKFNLLPDIIPERFSEDWFSHTSKERYLLLIQRYAKRVTVDQGNPAVPAPGDLALVKVGDARVFNHAGIVTRWPKVVHAGVYYVEETDAISDAFWARRTTVIFDFLNNHDR